MSYRRSPSQPTLFRETPDGHIEEIPLPTRFEVCPRCRGNGSHVNPSIDGNGLSREHMEDREFMEDYMAGVYDVPCYECDGRRVVSVVDEAQCDPALLAAYVEQEDAAAREWAAEAHLRRMESGGWRD